MWRFERLLPTPHPNVSSPFLVDQLVLRHILAQTMTIHLKGPQGRLVLLRVEDSEVVVGPHIISGNAADDVVEPRPGGEVTEPYVVLAATHRIDGVPEQLLDRADDQPTHVAVLVSFGQRVDVKCHLLRRVGRGSSTVHPILLAVFVAPVVEMGPLTVRHRDVSLFDPALDLLEQRVLLVSRMPQPLGEIVVLGFQIRQHVGIRSFSQPVVVVDANVAVRLEMMWALLGDGRRHRS